MPWKPSARTGSRNRRMSASVASRISRCQSPVPIRQSVRRNATVSASALIRRPWERATRRAVRLRSVSAAPRPPNGGFGDYELACIERHLLRAVAQPKPQIVAPLVECLRLLARSFCNERRPKAPRLKSLL
jgi:hypothetical protein